MRVRRVAQQFLASGMKRMRANHRIVQGAEHAFDPAPDAADRPVAAALGRGERMVALHPVADTSLGQPRARARAT